MHQNGWVMGRENATQHTRNRYRIVGKNPAMQGANIDPSLWIVHYGSADQGQRIPITSIPNNPHIMNTLRERQQLERQGQLTRIPFMLHDRSLWPRINLGPAQMPAQGGMYPSQMNPMHRNQQQQFYQQQQMLGQPPSKRMRHAPPGAQGAMVDPRMQPGMPPQPPIDTAMLDEEENVALGDLLDHMTPRDISLIRYTQHHEWMEEVFSSAYAASQIAPVDLGFGLSGELAEITQGLLSPPDETFSSDPSNSAALVKSGTYKKLEAGKSEELERRVNEYVQKGEEDLERMRAEHAKTLEQLRKGKTYLKAERQLREARNASHDDEDDPDFEPLDGVIQGVENSLNVTIAPRQDVFCVSKGGLIEEVPKPPQVNGDSSNDTSAAINGNGMTNGTMDNGSMAGDNTAAGLLDQFGNTTSFSNTPGANMSSQAQSASGTPGIASHDQSHVADFQAGGGEDPGDGMDLIEGMDLDIPELPDTVDEPTEKAADGDWVMVDDTAATSTSAAAPTAAEQSTAQTAAADSVTAQQPSSTSTDAAATAAQASTAATVEEATTSPGGIFDDVATAGDPTVAGTAPAAEDDDDFNDFTNLDSAGDALADFGGDDGAAGDALDDLGLGDDTFDDAEMGLELDTAADEAVDVATGAELGDASDAVTAGLVGEDVAAGEGAGADVAGEVAGELDTEAPVEDTKDGAEVA